MWKFTVIGLLLSSNISFGQTLVKEREARFDDHNHTVARAAIADDDPSDILKSFGKYAKKHYDVKLKRDGKTALKAEEVKIPAFTNKAGDFRARTTQENDSTYLELAYIFGYDMSINSTEHPESYIAMANALHNFALERNKEVYEDELKKHERKLKELNTQLSKNKKEQKAMSKTIKKNAKKVSKDKYADQQMELENESTQKKYRIEALDENNTSIEKRIEETKSKIRSVEDRLKILEAQKS